MDSNTISSGLGFLGAMSHESSRRASTKRAGHEFYKIYLFSEILFVLRDYEEAQYDLTEIHEMINHFGLGAKFEIHISKKYGYEIIGFGLSFLVTKNKKMAEDIVNFFAKQKPYVYIP